MPGALLPVGNDGRIVLLELVEHDSPGFGDLGRVGQIRAGALQVGIGVRKQPLGKFEHHLVVCLGHADDVEHDLERVLERDHLGEIARGRCGCEPIGEGGGDTIDHRHQRLDRLLRQGRGGNVAVLLVLGRIELDERAEDVGLPAGILLHQRLAGLADQGFRAVTRMEDVILPRDFAQVGHAGHDPVRIVAGHFHLVQRIIAPQPGEQAFDVPAVGKGGRIEDRRHQFRRNHVLVHYLLR